MKYLSLLILSLITLMSCAQNAKKTISHSSATNIPTTIIKIDTAWTNPIEKSAEEWKKVLSPEQFSVAREAGTERPFSSELNNIHEKGIFFCVCCQNPLFSYDTKFNSGTGWPSFYKPFSSKSVKNIIDKSQGMVREEVVCQRCNAHLGHVFDDGPAPTGLRYCMNGLSMTFQKETLNHAKISKATFAAGCFWCMEAIFESVKGVQEVISGYAGGKTENPTYRQVGSHTTGHAEAIEIIYDSTQVSFPDLIRVYYAAHDPTQVNGQGPDHGDSYRSILFYRNEGEKKIIEDYIAQLKQSGKYSKPIVTELQPYTKFWQAEDYHQNYVENDSNNPYVQQESIPRLKRTQRQVKDLIKPEKLLVE